MGKTFNILIVEDEKRIADILSKIIGNDDRYNPIVAHNGLEALAILKKHERGFGLLTSSIDCILLDWKMPNMNGEQFLTVLRKEERERTFRRHTPVVILSAFSDEQRWDRATNNIIGMVSGYIVKPVVKEELLSTLSRILIDKDSETLIELTREGHFSRKKQPRDISPESADES